MYKNGAKQSASGAAFSDNQCTIPNIRTEFPHFGSKIVEHSRHLPQNFNIYTRVERVPQLGQEAVEDVVRSVSVISLATCTCSMRTSGRSGKMMRVCKRNLEKGERWKKCSTSQY